MNCPRCQQDNPPDSRFCAGCGARLAAVCGVCGATPLAGSRFCNQCGTPLAAQTAVPSRFVSPEAYTPRHLAERILTSRSAVEGERKQVTVLFADVKGSLELLADRDPEQARKLLDPVLELMMEAVHRYEGTVNQVMGDGIMALFGAPLAQEDHAVRACYAALRMQAAVGRYAEQARRSEGVLIQVRVGLNSGGVVVRSIGSDLHMDYTAVGPTVHLAARMEQLAAPGSILISVDTLHLVEGYVEVKALGPTPVRGLAEPVETYEVIAAGPVRSRLQAAAARGLTRFVGREAEVELLRRVLQHADQGHGQVVAVVGEPGVGKSRLCFEFTRSHRVASWLVLESSAVSHGKATPYLPVIDLLKAYFRVDPRDDARAVREKVAGKVLMLDRSLEEALPPLLALLDVPVDDPRWQALDPPERRRRTLDAVKRLLLREARVQPLLLVFEDLHWIDSESQVFLDSLVDSLPTTRVLLLVNYRPEYRHDWGNKTYYTQVRLDALPRESAEELLDSLLGPDDRHTPLKRLVIERTEGNPFFLEETMRALVETKVLVGERGAYRLAGGLGDLRVPATVQAILAARIDRLPPDEKRLLQAASVIGKDVPFTLLQAIADADDVALRRQIAHLQAAEFLYESRLFPDLEYTFKHALTHEVAYGSLLHERRRAHHARIVEILEQIPGDRLPELVELLGHHALRGELWEKAVRYLAQAGKRALATSANTAALGFLEQALVALEHLPETRQTVELAIDLRFDLRAALLALGEFDRMQNLLREAETLAERIGDRVRLGWALSHMGEPLRAAGAYERQIEVAERALAIATAEGDPLLAVQLNFQLGSAYSALGAHEHALEFVGKNTQLRVVELFLEQARRGTTRPVPASFSLQARILADLGRFGQAIAIGEEGVRVAEASDRPLPRVTALAGLGRVYVYQGDVRRAVPLLERAVEASRSWDLWLLFHGSAAALAYAYAISGRMADAIPLLVETGDHLRSRKVLRPAASEIWLGEAYLAVDRLDDARRFATHACDLARARQETPDLAYALRLLGAIAAGGDPPDAGTGEACYCEAMAFANGLGMRPLVARCRLGLGALYRRTRRREEAREHVAAAADMFREMEMRFWLERAEAERASLG